MIKKSTRHRIHRTIGIVIVPLLLLSALTGFFRANHKWFWDEGYKKKKHPVAFSISSPLISVNDAARIIDSLNGNKNVFNYIRLKQETGQLFYEVCAVREGKYLLHAATGKLASPIKPELAIAIAKEYIKDSAKVRSCVLLSNYVTRKEKEIKAVFEVQFENDINSRIYLDFYTGEIVEDIDDNRQFGMWMVKLHDYDFFGSKRGISSVVGAGVVLLGLTGIWIYRRKKKRHRLKQHYVRKVVRVEPGNN